MAPHKSELALILHFLLTLAGYIKQISIAVCVSCDILSQIANQKPEIPIFWFLLVYSKVYSQNVQIRDVADIITNHKSELAFPLVALFRPAGPGAWPCDVGRLVLGGERQWDIHVTFTLNTQITDWCQSRSPGCSNTKGRQHNRTKIFSFGWRKKL
jgi:hypothetical protein